MMDANTRGFQRAISTLLAACLLAGLALAGQSIQSAQSAWADILGPAGSGRFAKSVIVLPNGNFVITDPYFTAGSNTYTGAVYLYNGATRALISQLTGGYPNDNVGMKNIIVLKNGNFVIASSEWDYHSGTSTGTGAVTFCRAATGCSGEVSAANSLVGSLPTDRVGYRLNRNESVIPLPDGNYVVISTEWSSDESHPSVGAVTWCSGITGCIGVVSAANSLVGQTSYDRAGYLGIEILANGNYVVSNPYWSNTGATGAGAVTWCSKTSGCKGPISGANSLVGTTSYDALGVIDYYYDPLYINPGITPLANGTYAVASAFWDNPSPAASDAGAITLCSGPSGCTGTVSSSNSLVGTHANDKAGDQGIWELANSSFVVPVRDWDNSATGAPDAGALTFCAAGGPCTGAISNVNSLVGTKANDMVGVGGVHLLSTGAYVAIDFYWSNGANTRAGAVTWCPSTGCTGDVTTGNSLVGSSAEDKVGYGGLFDLSSGRYVVGSPNWDNGAAADAGAITWCPSTGCTGDVTTGNSLVGSSAEDKVGYVGGGVSVLNAGGTVNYVVYTSNWDNGATTDAGAVTFCSGTTGCKGTISVANSLVGEHAGDQVGQDVTVLSNGDYTAATPHWTNGGVANAGGVTWCSGITGCKGTISAANSLVGTQSGDQVGIYIILALPGGGYVVPSPMWANGGTAQVGAVTRCPAEGCTGTISASNSLVGNTAGDQVGYDGLIVLANGNFVVRSHTWHNGSAVNAGAITWCNGLTGCIGPVTTANSLVGSTTDDYVGDISDSFEVESTGDYVVRTSFWQNGGIVGAGAVTLGLAYGGPMGPISVGNSVLGTSPYDGSRLSFSYDPVHRQLVVGQPYANKVSILTYPRVFLPLVRK